MAKKLLQFTAWKIPRKNDRVSATIEPFRGRRKRQPKGGRWRALRDVARPKMADSLGDHRVVRLAIDIQSFHFDRVSSLLHVNLTFKCRHAFMYIYIYNAWRKWNGIEAKSSYLSRDVASPIRIGLISIVDWFRGNRRNDCVRYHQKEWCQRDSKIIENFSLNLFEVIC